MTNIRLQYIVHAKFMVSALSRVKTKNCYVCTTKVSLNSVIARVRNSGSQLQSNSYSFRRGNLDFVRNSECPEWRSVRKARVDCISLGTEALGKEEGRGGEKKRKLATMSQEFECRPQYSPRLPAVLAVRIWPISANRRR